MESQIGQMRLARKRTERNTAAMRYVVRVTDPADQSVHLYRFTNETDAIEFADVMRRLGGEVALEGLEENGDNGDQTASSG